MRSPSRSVALAVFAVLAVLAVLTLLIAPAAALAAGPVAWDQSDLTSGSIDMNTMAIAADFALAEPTRLSAVTLWIADDVAGDNGVLDSFSGTLSWAIYGHDVDAPGSLVRSGAARAIETRDSGTQSNLGTDKFAVRFELDHPLLVAAGTWWLVVREGDWGAADDGSRIWWQVSNTLQGDFPTHRSSNLATPGDWEAYVVDAAFVLTGDPVAWDQGAVGGGAAYAPIGDAVSANDFLLAERTSFSAFDAWLMDEITFQDNGLLDTFSGELSWAFYADSIGDPGQPGTELASGTGEVRAVVDAGMQSSASSDVSRVRVNLGRSITLEPGFYWLALHENAWLSAFDDSQIQWYESSLHVHQGVWVDGDETAPGSWDVEIPFESAFVLIEDLVFASGFEAGTACAWAAAGTLCP